MINMPTFLSSFFSEHVLDKFSEFQHHVNSIQFLHLSVNSPETQFQLRNATSLF